MTKSQTAKVEKFLRDKIDAPFICAIRDDKGVQCFAHALYDPAEVFSLYVAQIDCMFKMLNGSPEQNAEFKKIFVEMLTKFAKEWSPHVD